MEDNLVNDSWDNWDDIDLSDLTEEVVEEQPIESEEAVVEDEGAEEPEADQQTETEARGEDTFTLKWMGEEKSYTREEVVPLAQKGMDYDRVKGKLEEVQSKYSDYDTIKSDLSKRNEQLYWLEELAKEQKMSLDDMIEVTQAQVMAKNTGKDISVCLGIVKNQRLERELKAREAKLTETDDRNVRRDADIDAFMKAYPDKAADPKALPEEVWEAVRNGESLVSAYRAYEVKELRAQLERQKAEAEKQKQKEINKSRSTGSQSSKGKSAVDPLDEIWNDGT